MSILSKLDDMPEADPIHFGHEPLLITGRHGYPEIFLSRYTNGLLMAQDMQRIRNKHHCNYNIITVFDILFPSNLIILCNLI